MKNKAINPLILLILGLLLSCQLNAQAAIFAALFGDKVASEHFNLSMEIGPTLSNFGDIDGSKAKLGVNFGIAGNIKLNENIHISPTAYFLAKRHFKLNSFSLNTNDTELNGRFNEVPTDFSINYIDVPIFIHYQFMDSNLGFGIAPQVSFKQKVTATFDGEAGDFTQSVTVHAKDVDYGVIASLNYFWQYKRDGKGLMVSLRYYQGFTDTFEDSFIDGNNRGNYFSLHISLPFVTDEIASKNLEKQTQADQ